MDVLIPSFTIVCGNYCYCSLHLEKIAPTFCGCRFHNLSPRLSVLEMHPAYVLYNGVKTGVKSSVYSVVEKTFSTQKKVRDQVSIDSQSYQLYNLLSSAIQERGYGR